MEAVCLASDGEQKIPVGLVLPPSHRLAHSVSQNNLSASIQ